MVGSLVLAATPIGRVGDAPPRLAEELTGADVVAAEDTRRLKRLCDDLGITLTGRVVSYFDGNETARTPASSSARRGGASPTRPIGVAASTREPTMGRW